MKPMAPYKPPEDRFEWVWRNGEQLLYDYRGVELPTKPWDRRKPVARVWMNPDGTWFGSDRRDSFSFEEVMQYNTEEEAKTATIAMYLLKDKRGKKWD